MIIVFLTLGCRQAGSSSHICAQSFQPFHGVDKVPRSGQIISFGNSPLAIDISSQHNNKENTSTETLRTFSNFPNRGEKLVGRQSMIDDNYQHYLFDCHQQNSCPNVYQPERSTINMPRKSSLQQVRNNPESFHNTLIPQPFVRKHSEDRLGYSCHAYRISNSNLIGLDNQKLLKTNCDTSFEKTNYRPSISKRSDAHQPTFSEKLFYNLTKAEDPTQYLRCSDLCVKEDYDDVF